MEAAAVVCAAGSSVRMGGIKKEYQKLNSGITVLESAVCAFTAVPSIEIIVIAICADAEDAARASLSPETLSLDKPKILFVNGGESRRASVFNALSLLAQYKPSYVLIHDGARPWVTVNLVKNIIEGVKKYDAVIPLLPLTDTPKECVSPLCETHGVFIKRHLKRANMGTAQTPQAFKFPEILYAHEKAAKEDEEFTDDAEIWGEYYGPVAVIHGEPENRKITFQGDI
jgi:2-C-methyl-D-erythritol 4-phosphate cytidylyltransferase